MATTKPLDSSIAHKRNLNKFIDGYEHGVFRTGKEPFELPDPTDVIADRSSYRYDVAAYRLLRSSLGEPAAWCKGYATALWLAENM